MLARAAHTHRDIAGRRLRGHVQQQLLRRAVRHVQDLRQVRGGVVQAVARGAQAAREQLGLQRGRELQLMDRRLAGEGRGAQGAARAAWLRCAGRARVWGPFLVSCGCRTQARGLPSRQRAPPAPPCASTARGRRGQRATACVAHARAPCPAPPTMSAAHTGNIFLGSICHASGASSGLLGYSVLTAAIARRSPAFRTERVLLGCLGAPRVDCECSKTTVWGLPCACLCLAALRARHLRSGSCGHYQ